MSSARQPGIHDRRGDVHIGDIPDQQWEELITVLATLCIYCSPQGAQTASSHLDDDHVNINDGNNDGR